jgi:phosphoribosylformylglycinamidine synthase
LPKKKLVSAVKVKPQHHAEFDEPGDLNEDFIKMAGRHNTAAFSFISTQYDHEVQGGSVIKPLQGKGRVNGNATVFRPLLDSRRGVVMSQGLYPSYSEIDAYRMAACSIDTAVRNAVAAGGSIDRMAVLDNFCWCDPLNPERLGQLREAARACYDYSVAYGTPFISGKDSMFNDFKGYGGSFEPVFISIPPTLLVSSIGVIEDVSFCQTLDFKAAGDLIYVIGSTYDELDGSEYFAYAGEKLSTNVSLGGKVPNVDAVGFANCYRAFEAAMRRGLTTSSLSVERGGLGLAIVKSSLGGLMGCRIDLSAVPGQGSRSDYVLFSESQGRMLVSINPSNKNEFESHLKGLPFGIIGETSADDSVVIKNGGKIAVETSLKPISDSYFGRFADY